MEGMSKGNILIGWDLVPLLFSPIGAVVKPGLRVDQGLTSC